MADSHEMSDGIEKLKVGEKLRIGDFRRLLL